MGDFKKNYYKVFGHKLPDMDTVAGILKTIPEEELENLKAHLVSHLIEKKVFDKWRFQGDVVIAIDGTGLVSFDHEHCPYCLTKESKNGKKTWFHNVLEAKIVTSNGFSISICTEWIENPGIEYNKQDCERKAFERLACKLKKMFPRLSICLCADGLYPNNTFFNICQNNGWRYIVTLKDGNLKRLWQKIKFTPRPAIISKEETNETHCLRELQWINNIEFSDFIHNWIENVETLTNKITGESDKKRYVHLTNIEINNDNALLINQTGRLRWNIENQGFDIQKNHGYNICHKYCRKSYLGMKNFYQCCQIAHLINQLTELSKSVQAMLTNKRSIAIIWDFLKWFLTLCPIDDSLLLFSKNHKTQIQFTG